jgi:2-polyprenyl-6-methoxyphenol hydroxylase-like FAD-dependent oxidoreductase
MASTYDVIVVGARCAGAPTAMLLARKGHRVLLVDRASFPSDTLSTHQVHIPGVAALKRWGLLERLMATGCPPISRYSFDFGPFVIAGSPRAVDGVQAAYAPRRTVLDALLVEAAAEAGVEVRQSFGVDGLLTEDGVVTGISGRSVDGVDVVERAALVVGADGLHSIVARNICAPQYHARPALEAGYYAYWSGVPTQAFEIYVRPYRSFAAIPTHDDLVCIVVTWPTAEFEANRRDIEGNYLQTLQLAPAFAERVSRGVRESRFRGTGDLPNFFRKPFGPGWALVGDAGYHKDPCTAQGISDAFRDAELLSGAIDQVLGGGRPFEAAMLDYQHARDDAVLPMFELTCDLATLAPPDPDLAELLVAVSRNRSAMDDFCSVIAGTLPVPEFFSAENRQRVLEATPQPISTPTTARR